MKLNYKKYLYLVNDITNILLKKEREQLSETAGKLRLALIITSAALLLSLLLNVYLLLK